MGLGKTIQVIAFLAQLREFSLEDADGLSETDRQLRQQQRESASAHGGRVQGAQQPSRGTLTLFLAAAWFSLEVSNVFLAIS